jgi:alkylation response protein AidB-like acyl-CoA dehydrogenase
LPGEYKSSRTAGTDLPQGVERLLMSGPSVAEYAEYCHTQAGLLAGRIETLQAAADRLLGEIDAETETVRKQLESGQAADSESAVGAIEAKQASVREIQTRIATCSDVASGYTDLAHRLADLKERGEMRPQHVSMAKRNNVRMARDQSRVAREILGGNGITADYSPMRHMANLETVYTYEGTHDIHTLILGEDLTGFAAYE